MLAVLVIFLLLSSSCCGFKPLVGKSVIKVSDKSVIDLGDYISSLSGDSMLVLGTYCADFNTIEYCQKIKYYQNQLKEKNVKNILLLVNAQPSAVEALGNLMELPKDITLLSDATGDISKSFGVSRGYRPDDDISPYLKLFLMFFGLGNVMTLPSVIGGYIGNPFGKNIGWIEDSLIRNTKAQRFPTTAVELDPLTEKMIRNKFSELPLVGTWNVRPLELATLRLQNMIGISLQHWNELKPSDDELKRGILTQLGGLLILPENTSDIKYKWLDDGICHSCSFANLIERL